ncbi:hypothetical protein [Haloactinopolyspora sp.]|uniref:hypothetical protein n=1 Tax=Haloactinopolyspora sp. TaxID=1966353 RepID=UPI002624604A|nr:hypothetical protein [Haloactinopolyspora sp.]
MSEDRRSPDLRMTRRRRTSAVVIGVLLAALLVLPWPQNMPKPIILGIIPAPLFFWVLWTGAFIAYVAWIAFRWDPYADVVRRNAPANDDER